METSKTQRLVLILEGLALVTALILILVDYKLKNDLVALYQKMEQTLEDGKQIFGENASNALDSMRLPSRAMVGDDASVETSDSPVMDNPNGQSPANKRTPSNRRGRAGGTEIPKSDKPLGS